MIVVEDVFKRYRTDHGPGKWVLEGISFTVPQNTNIALIGRNGAGKSTLLKLIGKVDVPTRGHISRDCRVSWPLGFGGGLQGSRTGRQNAKFICRVHGDDSDLRDRLEFIRDFSELGEAFDEPIKTYSTGMRARLNFSMSLAFDFDVYLVDEITAVGDAAFKKKTKEAFNTLAKRAGMIMVSHAEETLRQYCSAGIWLHQGKAHWFDNVNDALTAYKQSLAA
jgi:capsular polysaccharide transport system ATP-binding protein